MKSWYKKNRQGILHGSLGPKHLCYGSCKAIDKNVYKDVSFNEKLIQDLTKASNKVFRNLKNRGFITDKELKYFSFGHKGACNLAELYFLPKIHKRLFSGCV